MCALLVLWVNAVAWGLRGAPKNLKVSCTPNVSKIMGFSPPCDVLGRLLRGPYLAQAPVLGKEDSLSTRFYSSPTAGKCTKKAKKLREPPPPKPDIAVSGDMATSLIPNDPISPHTATNSSKQPKSVKIGLQAFRSLRDAFPLAIFRFLDRMPLGGGACRWYTRKGGDQARVFSP